VENLHLARLVKVLSEAGIETKTLSIAPGEGSKSWETLQTTVDWMLANKIERNDIVVALGGGVVGDLVGFAAAILRRGIRFIQCPTSLLAQVDSSVGGKTGINTPHGKNLVGSFYQPSKVISDISTLLTIKERDFLAGYGEVVKYGLLGDYDFYCWLEANFAKIKERETETLIKAVAHSCEMKAQIVINDEKEHGERALLNLGHTFCHALESATGYSDRMLHGEGVAIGCILAFDLSAKMKLTSQEDPIRIKKHFTEMGLMNSITDISGVLPDADHLVELMFQDKKVVNGKLNLILTKGIGNAFIARDIDPNLIKSVINDSLYS
jgi:3-dehydroquinate synthase